MCVFVVCCFEDPITTMFAREGRKGGDNAEVKKYFLNLI